MISEGETFGLVYLEAMACGCITIASRGEGMDGIIEDGVNGFLCKPGDVQELQEIIEKIDALDQKQLYSISYQAYLTARRLTDIKVAENYLNELNNIKKIIEIDA
jgi:glycosyltransferase involved in cell wall biosynthesis